MLVHRGSLNHFLSNGIELSFSNNGAISFDLSGQVSEKKTDLKNLKKSMRGKYRESW